MKVESAAARRRRSAPRIVRRRTRGTVGGIVRPLPWRDRTALTRWAMAVLLAILLPASAPAQVPPDGSWATRTTPHFRVTYPDSLPELGARAAVRAEAAWAVLSEHLDDPPDDRVEIVVSDHTDLSNGYARVFPLAETVIIAAPPVDRLSLSHFDDWLDLVLVHELAHVFHLDRSGPAGTAIRSIFGRVPLLWPPFPGLATPGWTREGLATWYESELTSAGRSRGSYFEMVLRTAALEGEFEDLDQVSGSSPIWPGGDRAYVYGTRFLEYLEGLTGPEALADFVEAVADQWIPFRLGSAGEDVFGVELEEAWEDWRAGEREDAERLRDSLAARAALTRADALTDHGRWALRPLPSPDGRFVAYARSDGVSDPQLHLIPVSGGSRASGRDGGALGRGGAAAGDVPGGTAGGRLRPGTLARTNGLADFTWTPGGEIVFSQHEYLDRYRLRSDLFRVGAGGSEVRLTRGARLDHPDVASDGTVAVAVQAGRGTNRLVEVDLDAGSLRPLTEFDADVHWAFPSISPDGDRIAVSRWRSGEIYDVVLLDREGRLVEEVTRDRAVDLAPRWSPDGRWLLWSTDRSGIWNVVAVAVEEGAETVGSERVQLTNVLTGALYPSVDPAGEWLYFSAYHADGWAVERIPFRPDDGFDPFPPDPRVVDAPPSSAAGIRGDFDPGTPEEYSALPTIFPRYWLPSIVAPREALLGSGIREVLGWSLGARTAGRDVLGRHAYSASAGVTVDRARFEGSVAYAYTGLGNPVLGAFAYQGWDAAPRFLRATDGSGASEDVVRLERERGAGASAGLVRRRYRDALGLTLTGGFVRERAFFLTPDARGGLEESRFQPVPASRDLVETGLVLSGGHTRSHPFSISLEDGVQGILGARMRTEVGIADSVRSLAGVGRSFLESTGELFLYKGFAGPGFANHVLALRAAGGVAGGAGAQAFHFDVGGGRGSGDVLTGYGFFGGETSSFPVRGFQEGVRFGRYAWSGSAEYRFPLLLVNQGWGLLPLHFDRISGAAFLDAGDAWGPVRASGLPLPFHNPRRGVLASAGLELSLFLLPLWSTDIQLRSGLAVPLRGGEGTSFYVRVGPSF